MARKTQDELLAEAQARVAALEAKAEERKQKEIKGLLEQRTKAVERITADTDKVEAIDTQLMKLGYEWPTTEDVADESFATDGVTASV
jgi:putative N-acetylmannosamine-6-phosphate epimerase